MISIGILTFNSPITLKNNLESYKYSGILKFCDDIKCLIQPSLKTQEEIDICNQFNLKYIVEEKNTMMAGGIKKLVEQSKYEYFLFLESDFRSCKNENVTKKILEFSINSIKKYNLDVIRLRSLKKPGHPIHWNLQKRQGIAYNDNTELYLCTHYLREPHKAYPEYIKKINDSPTLYKMSSKNCVYTNNPNITSKEFYINNILPFALNGSHLEPEIFNFWKNNQFNIGITSGIFTHERTDGHSGRSCYCCNFENGGRSNNINCVCCIKPYKYSFFNEQQLEETDSDIIDESFLNDLYNKLQFNYFSNARE